MGLALVQAAQQPEAAAEEGWADLLKPRYRWIMLLTTILPLVQQLSGINTCILYSSEVRLAPGIHPDFRHFCTGTPVPGRSAVAAWTARSSNRLDCWLLRS